MKETIDIKQAVLKTVYSQLSADLPAEAIEKTSKADTGRGYDTTGYGYQYEVNRFNDVLGLKQWGFWWKIINVIEGKFSSGKPCFEVAVDVSIWVLDRENFRHAPGGHLSGSYSDALKGAVTNGFKKTAAFWGVGKKAYEGSIDDDNVAQDKGLQDRTEAKLPEPIEVEEPPRKEKGEVDPITTKQKEVVKSMLKSHLYSDDEKEKMEASYKSWSIREASIAIDWWFRKLGEEGEKKAK